MSATPKFLPEGSAQSDVNTLRNTLKVQYYQWAIVVLLPRQWSREKRANKLYAPAFVLLFARNSEEDIFTTRSDSWHLLFYDLKMSCQEVVWETKGAELISDIFTKIPVGLQPSSLSVICVTDGHTHERLHLFSERAFSLFKSRMEQVFRTLNLKNHSVRWHRVGELITETSATFTGGPFPEFMADALLWSRNNTPEAVDVSAPSQVGNDALLALLPKLNPLLYTTAFQEPEEESAVDPVAIVDSGIANSFSSPSTKSTLPVSLVEQRRLAVAELKKRVGHIASFRIDGTEPLNSPTTPISTPLRSYCYVLLVQRPYVQKEEVSFENLNPGPLSPQPIAAELHIMQDNGELLHVQKQLCDEKVFDVNYEDLLHEDGEIFVQLTPFEGISFDDLDRYFNIVGSNVDPLPVPLCEGSCCGLTFPKVVLRGPSGIMVKDTLIASPHAEIIVTSPTLQEHWEAAKAALLFLSEKLVPLPNGEKTSSSESRKGYTLPRGIAPIPVPTHNDACTWCGRRRNKLLRCGGCRVEMYCSKKHQMIDWKDGGHRRNCALWGKAKSEYESRVTPMLNASAPKLPATPIVSSVVTLLNFLSAWRGKMRKTGAALIVHILGLDHEAAEFLAELGRHASTVAALLAGSSDADKKWEQLRLVVCSEAFDAAERNAVYMIDHSGVVERTLSTTVLGDSWHLATPSAKNALALVRLYDTKYHIFAQEVISCIKPGGDFEVAPAAVLSLGSWSGTGMNYFTAATEVLTDYFVGVIPVMCTEPTLVSAHQTLAAIMARLESSSKASPDVKAKLPSCCDPDKLIQLNISGVCPSLLETKTEDGSIVLTTKQMALKRHSNLYMFCMPVEP